MSVLGFPALPHCYFCHSSPLWWKYQNSEPCQALCVCFRASSQSVIKSHIIPVSLSKPLKTESTIISTTALTAKTDVVHCYQNVLLKTLKKMFFRQYLDCCTRRVKISKVCNNQVSGIQNEIAGKKFIWKSVKSLSIHDSFMTKLISKVNDPYWSFRI